MLVLLPPERRQRPSAEGSHQAVTLSCELPAVSTPSPGAGGAGTTSQQALRGSMSSVCILAQSQVCTRLCVCMRVCVCNYKKKKNKQKRGVNLSPNTDGS